MLSFLPAFLIGIFTTLLCVINLLLWPIPVFLGALLRLIPIKPWQRFWTAVMHRAVTHWADGNTFVQWLMLPTKMDIQGTENLKPDDWYLLISNHISWIDIFVLLRVFNRKIPSLKFFMKKQLLWTLPLAGVGAWLLDFPFMGRYSKSFLAKHPEYKGRDQETTRKACEKFKDTPTAIINFAEGTRFTWEKHQRQAPPYQHLLRPRAGGVAFALSALGQSFHKILSVTIVYPDAEPNTWNFASGKIKKIIVRVEELPVTAELIGDYENDREFRVQFQGWMNNLWERKDAVITEILNNEK